MTRTVCEAEKGSTTIVTRLCSSWAVAALVACALAGCAGRSTGVSPSTPHRASVWTAAACRQQTQSIADDALQILVQYRLANGEPPDVAYLAFQSVLYEFQRHECRPQILGETLDGRLTHRQLTDLLSHLPSSMVRYLLRTRACWKASKTRLVPLSRIGKASACSGSWSSVRSISVGKPAANPFPLNP